MYRVSPNARNAGAFSPSVALERGNIRVQSASDAKPSTQQPLRLRPSRKQAKANRNLASVIILLALASFMCFFFAYYLWTTRCDSRDTQHPKQCANDRTQVHATEALASSQSADRFLAYLPHSGYHNQRIALENALVLAQLLNRTLLVPPVLLGEPIAYHSFDVLRRYLHLMFKNDLLHCRTLLPNQPHPPECFGYQDYTTISWDTLIDMSAIRKIQPVFLQKSLSNVALERVIGEPLANQYYLRDTSKYHYRFVDTTHGKPSVHKYTETITILSLRSRPEKLIHLGSLFSTSRLRLRKPEHRAIRNAVRSLMDFIHPALLLATKRIQTVLVDGFVGAHLRVGDGTFEDSFYDVARQTWRDLTQNSVGLEAHLIHHLESFVWNGSDVLLSERKDRNTKTCRSALYSGPPWTPLNTPLFVATDAQHPESHPAVLPFIKTFPCTFFLHDFETIFGPIMDDLENAEDGVKLKRFFIPFLDAMVVSKARKVVGTSGSTFSQFVVDVLWTRNRGMPIISRG